MSNQSAPQISVNTLVSKPMLERLITATCLFFQITEDELMKGSGQDQIYKKHVCWYLIKDNVNISLYRIGQRFNNESHTTVMRAVEKISVQKNIYAHTLHEIRKIKELADTLA